MLGLFIFNFVQNEVSDAVFSKFMFNSSLVTSL